MNYKQQFIDRFDINGYVHNLKTSELVVHLSKPNANESVPISLKSLATATAYKVPSGKQLKIFYRTSSNTTAAAHIMYTTTVVDSMTGSVEIMSRTVLDGTDGIIIELLTIDENLYITFDSATAANHGAEFIGWEETK